MNSDSKTERELTALEYVILGFLAVAPQSGYTIIGRFEVGRYRWSASAGSIYPVLKRLEASKLISSYLEAEHETRPRKMYTLLPEGAALLDEWLRQPPRIREIIEEYDIALHKFLIAEVRLSRAEVLDWLEQYQTLIIASHQIHDSVNRVGGKLTTHEQLLNRSLSLEIEARRLWVEEAIACLTEGAST